MERVKGITLRHRAVKRNRQLRSAAGGKQCRGGADNSREAPESQSLLSNASVHNVSFAVS
jgi:hypothetical protein